MKNFIDQKINKFSPSEKEASPAKDKMRKIITKKQTPSFAKKFISKNNNFDFIFFVVPSYLYENFL